VTGDANGIKALRLNQCPSRGASGPTVRNTAGGSKHLATSFYFDSSSLASLGIAVRAKRRIGIEWQGVMRKQSQEELVRNDFMIMGPHPFTHGGTRRQDLQIRDENICPGIHRGFRAICLSLLGPLQQMTILGTCHLLLSVKYRCPSSRLPSFIVFDPTSNVLEKKCHLQARHQRNQAAFRFPSSDSRLRTRVVEWLCLGTTPSASAPEVVDSRPESLAQCLRRYTYDEAKCSLGGISINPFLSFVRHWIALHNE
jgi:hypothetical protein